MIVYWLLLIPIAAISYCTGSLSTISMGSMFYHKNLRKLGRGNKWLSNFHRIYGIKGIVTLLLIEVLRNLLPVLIGGWLMAIKDQAAAGRAFAGFCLVLGRLWPVFNHFHGSYGIGSLLIAGICIRPAAGFVSLLIFAFLLWRKRSMSMAVLVSTVIFVASAMILIDENIVMTLCIFMGVMVLIKLVPKLVLHFRGEEEKLSFKEDISYKFDQKF